MRARYCNLAEFFEHTQPKRTHQWLADRLGVDRSYVTLIANGLRQPSLELALRIEEETGVPLKSLVTPDATEASA